jgi:hypothetical protein
LLALLAIPLRHAIADPTFLPNTDMMDASYRNFYLPKPWPRLFICPSHGRAFARKRA